MLARIQSSNFLKVPLWVVNISNKDSKDIFVKLKGEVLQKSYFKFRVLSLFQIPRLADV
jgi:hypothetical protein